MIKRLRIAMLKRRARALCLRLDEHYDRYDCGASLADAINPGGRRLKENFEAVYARLRDLDPTAPPFHAQESAE